MDLMHQIYNYMLYAFYGCVGIGGVYLLSLFKFNGQQTTSDLLRHTYTIGETGTGKSTKCLNDIIDCIDKGFGCLYIDIHGKDSTELLNCIPTEHAHRVIYINPSDQEDVIGFSIFSENKGSMENELSVDSLISIFDILWPEFIGPSTEDILRMSALAVIPQSPGTLMEIYLMLVDQNYRDKIKIQDAAVSDFWINTFPEMIKKDKSRLNPPTNKLRKLIMSKICRLTLCQRTPKFNMMQAMQENKIIICNFSKGKIGHDTAKLLSALMVCKLQMCTFKRNSKSTPFFCFLDEFQNYVTKSFSEILSEARKYNISLNLYHQYFHQIPEFLQHAIRGNVGSRYAFRVDDDALMVSYMFDIEQKDIKTLDNYYCYCKRLVNGKKEETMIIKSPSPPKIYGHAKDIIKQSKKYAVNANMVMRDINSRLKVISNLEGNVNEF